jgi:muconolactone delta-isomerase
VCRGAGIGRPAVTNLVATLRGTQPESADRVYVVSGHYDSRCTDVLNFTCDAPGADDDASGVAAVLELARVMAKRQFDATIVFMAVAGEEQNLFGSTFFAQQAKAAGMDVEGMFTNDIIGSSTSDKGRRDPFPVRLFSEGVPTAETPQQAALRQSIGGENDGPSRQLARYVKEVGENSATGMHGRLVWRRDRFLRGGDQIPFLQQGPMLYMLRFDITQPAGMSTDEFWKVWHEEAKAALGAKEAGAVVDLWKVAGERTVFALCDFPDGDALDRALSSLPISVALGAGAKTTTWAVYPYEQFAAS